jgi:hypothetical protein
VYIFYKLGFIGYADFGEKEIDLNCGIYFEIDKFFLWNIYFNNVFYFCEYTHCFVFYVYI